MNFKGMNQEIRQCQNCEQDFTVEPDDFLFYEKIQVLAPTWCPMCRMQRRFVWRNERYLYRRPDSRTGEMIFSAIPAESPLKIYELNYWISDAFDPFQYGRDIDWGKPFLLQVHELMKEVPWPSRAVLGLVDSDYAMNADYLKNCYLVMASSYSENCAYSVWIRHSSDSLDLYNAAKAALCYNSSFLQDSYRTFFSLRVESSQNVVFCRDCIGCAYCFGCANLRNKSYCIFNKQHSKEDYAKEVQKFDLGSYDNLQRIRGEVFRFWNSQPVRFVTSRHNHNVSGEYIYHSKNVKDSYNVQEAEDSRYIQNILFGPAKDLYDYTNWGGRAEFVYESLMCGEGVSQCVGSFLCWPDNHDIYYCMNCRNTAYCFGCVGVKKKQYCILNKQYSSEEYAFTFSRLVKHMKDMPYKDWRGRTYSFGDFFPLEFSPIPYNESLAQEYFPFTDNEARDARVFWREPEKRDYTSALQTDDLPIHIRDTQDSIIKEVIRCAHGGSCGHNCTYVFRITPRELEFYRNMNVALPRLCFHCRHAERIRMMSGLELYARTCDCAGTGSRSGSKKLGLETYRNITKHFHGDAPCSNAFETSYSSDGTDIVYCEECYRTEVT